MSSREVGRAGLCFTWFYEHRHGAGERGGRARGVAALLQEQRRRSQDEYYLDDWRAGLALAISARTSRVLPSRSSWGMLVSSWSSAHRQLLSWSERPSAAPSSTRRWGRAWMSGLECSRSTPRLSKRKLGYHRRTSEAATTAAISTTATTVRSALTASHTSPRARPRQRQVRARDGGGGGGSSTQERRGRAERVFEYRPEGPVGCRSSRPLGRVPYRTEGFARGSIWNRSERAAGATPTGPEGTIRTNLP